MPRSRRSAPRSPPSRWTHSGNRISRPVFCFDGDAAGRKAGRRAIGLALPLLAPERSLGIVVLPEGEDPDTVVGRRGRQGMADELARDDLGAAIYGLLKDEVGPISPEGWAQLRNRLDEAARTIPDRALADTYRAALRDRWYQDRRGASGGGTGVPRNGPGFGQGWKGKGAAPRRFPSDRGPASVRKHGMPNAGGFCLPSSSPIPHCCRISRNPLEWWIWLSRWRSCVMRCEHGWTRTLFLTRKP